jgi:hypothetical protein
MDRQTLRDWVIRYNEHGIDGLLDCWGSGRPPRLDADEQAELYAIVLAGPDPEKGWDLRLHPRGPGADLRAAVRQDHAPWVDGTAAAKDRSVATKGAPQPPAQRPGLAGGL